MSKATRYLLDTHVFLWLMLSNKQLREKRALETAALTGGLLVCPITCWEIGMLTSRGRVHFGMPCQEWIEKALKAPGISVLELSPRIAVEASYLPGKFHGDPSDRMLIAAARINNLVLATADEKILKYSEQGYVKVLRC